MRPRLAEVLSGVLSALLWAVVWVGCATHAPPQVDFSSGHFGISADSFPKAHSTWTRHQKNVTEMGTLVEVWATFKSPQYREAYLAKYAQVYALAPSDQAVLAKAEAEDHASHLVFVLTVQSTEFSWNDLEDPDSAWRFILEDGYNNQRRAPEVTVQEFPEPYNLVFHPEMTPFTRTYLVRFPRPAVSAFSGEQSGVLTLKLVSPLGGAELEWRATKVSTGTPVSR